MARKQVLESERARRDIENLQRKLAEAEANAAPNARDAEARELRGANLRLHEEVASLRAELSQNRALQGQHQKEVDVAMEEHHAPCWLFPSQAT